MVLYYVELLWMCFEDPTSCLRTPDNAYISSRMRELFLHNMDTALSSEAPDLFDALEILSEVYSGC